MLEAGHVFNLVPGDQSDPKIKALKGLLQGNYFVYGRHLLTDLDTHNSQKLFNTEWTMTSKAIVPLQLLPPLLSREFIVNIRN